MNLDEITEKLIAPMTAESMPQILALFLDKAMANRHLGIKSDVMQIWKKEDLLWSEHADKTKKSFSLVETVWLGIVRELRRFKVPFEAIRKLKHDLQPKFNNQTNEQQNSDTIKYLEKKGVPDGAALLESPEQKELSALITQNFTMLMFLTYYALHAKKYVAINYKLSGEFEPVIPDFIEDIGGSLEDLFLHGHHIHISISQIINEIMGCANLDVFSKSFMAISSREKEILEALRQKDIKSVKVSLSKQGIIKYLEVTRPKLKAKMGDLVEAVTSSHFNDITIRTENGKIVMFENKVKRKL